MKFASQKQALAVSVVAALILAACGGGGGSQSAQVASPSAQPDAVPTSNSKPAGVFITEVANQPYYNVTSWFEIYNNSGHAISLSDYLVRARSVNPGTGVAGPVEIFVLPQQTLNSGSRIVVAGKASAGLVNSANVVYIADAQGNIPSWTGGSGFIELLSAGQTLDFIRMGLDTTAPTSVAGWTGPAVTAMSNTTSTSMPAYGNVPNSMNQSIVRLDSNFTQTHSAADWTTVNFATPGGPNDVPAGVVDSDNDGIPDSAKVAGGTFNGIDLYGMGARRGQRDMFVQVDYMDHSAHNDPGIILQKRALDNVVAAFLPHNIHIHFDAGTLFSASFSTANYNLGALNNQHPFTACVGNNQYAPGVNNTSGCTDIYTIKASTFDYRRSSIFRYMLMGYSQSNPPQAGGSSGVAEIMGPNFLITLGNWGLVTTTTADVNAVVNYQAATIMHEMGHTLGLLHGGYEDTNYKPNYLSIMNYMYQLNGVPDASGAVPAGHGISEINERYYLYQWELQHGPSTDIVPGVANSSFMRYNMHNGPATTTFNLDYSNGSGAALSESALVESNVVGRTPATGAFADWDLSGSQTPGTLSSMHIVDQAGDTAYDTNMQDFDDWSNLVLAFARYPESHFAGASQKSASSSNSSTPTVRFNPVSNPRMPAVAEEPLSAAALAHMRGN
ncbi:lamin tail domain-containing protein [Silvimonas iriomotensis]|uniref:LTD domain-containing protein n=1 Tax=Silvimonas iriomotensis TaxID=449662 RepID=A0ABQ2PDE2_9NEIS|nr:lamin tail domain-containing protein [Silvimonas iriomotensis]GGP23525.1 hypothetical protein GCM10010970_35250 [Silvimonas iriomotensis]